MSTMIETLTSYVPVLITRHLATDLTPITEPAADSFPAAVLFADISGFTALTERLAQQGPAGAEELTGLLNTYFGQLIDLISAHGGDVVKFAGDALLAVWPARAGVFPGLEDDLGVATQRAVQCGWAIQQELGRYQPAEGVHLSLKLAVGTGKISALQLGGVYQRWEFLVTGNPLMQVGVAESYANPGDVILSPEVWMLLGDDCSGERLAADNVRLKRLNFSLPLQPITSPALAPEAENALRAYIPGAILSRLAAGQSGWLAELRPITVLFINLPHLNDTVSVADAQIAMETLQEMIYRYEGSINKLSVDDKGTTLIAALGLPPLAHEDDPARAVQAAIAIQAQLQAMQVRGAIGIAGGRIYCGSVGNNRRREYTMIGNAVNLAARLMQAAGAFPPSIPPKGGEGRNEYRDSPSHREGVRGRAGGQIPILCDEATFQSAQSQIKFDTLPPISVKGKAGPVAIYRPIPQLSIPVFNSEQVDSAGQDAALPAKSKIQNPKSKIPMVGRVQEKMMLAEQLQAILRGESGVIIIEGEAGIGKSRLVDDVLEHARTVGVSSFIGAGDAIEKNTPYHAWRPVFHQFFQLDSDPLLHGPSGHLAEAQQAQVLARIEAIHPELMRLAPLLKAVLPLDLPDNKLTAQMTGEVRADNTHDLFVQILQAIVPEAPTMFIMEDAHWLDSASWALLRLVSRDVKPLMLVIATRPITDPVPAEYKQLLTIPNNHHLRLEVLPIEEALTLVSRRLGVTSLPELVAELIEERAEGHPFYSEELAYALRDAGLIAIKDGRCRVVADVSDLRDLDFPDTLHGVVTSRIDRLTPQQQLTLKAASVIGRVFTFRTLRDIHPIEADKAHLQEYLDALERLDLTPLDTPEPDLAYIFKHVITQEVAYNLMAFAQRRKLHRAIAEWFERTYADDLSPFHPLLAYHWRNTLDNHRGDSLLVSKTIDYLEKAGEQALNSSAYQEAVEFFDQTLSLSIHQEIECDQLRQARWERYLAEAHYKLGNMSEATKHQRHSLALLGQSMPTTRGRLVMSLLWQILLQTSHLLWPKKFVNQGNNGSDALMEAVRGFELGIQIYYFVNEPLSMLHNSVCGLNLAEIVRPSQELARLYSQAGLITGLFSFHTQAERYVQQASRVAQIENNIETLAFVLQLTGLYHFGAGQLDKAYNNFDQAIDLFNELGDRRRWEESFGLLAGVIGRQGEFSRAVRMWTEVYTTARRGNDTQAEAYGLLGQVENILRLRHESRSDEITDFLQEVEALLSEDLDAQGTIWAYGLLAILRLRQGKEELARKAAEMGTQLITRLPATGVYVFEGYAGVAEVQLTQLEAAYHQLSDQRKVLNKSAQQACKGLRKFARIFRIGQPRSWLYNGLYAWLNGKHRKAHKAWQKSLVYAQQLQMPYEAGLAHYHIGRHSEGETRREHLTQAIQIFEQLGANHDLGRAHQELNRK